MDPQTKVKLIIKKSLQMMIMGTIVVLLISDPMVDVLNSIGVVLNIDAFYIGFVLAPIASNAPEIIAGFGYAGKQTKKTISISLASLQGVGCMNITFALGMFYLLFILDHGLKWEFTAEATSLLFVQFVLIVLSFKKSYSGFTAIFIILLYPVSLAVV